MTEQKLQPKDLWMLLFDDPMKLTDDQIAQLIEAKEKLRNLIDRFPHNLEEIQRYRIRKKELSKFTTEELLKIKQEMAESRAAALAQDERDEDLPDSFFEAPSIDSQEHIVNEILRERGAIK